MNSKKLIAGMIALAIAGTTVASNAQAATAEELAAQIAALQSQLSGLMGQLGGTSSGTTASGVTNTNIAACTGITFSRNLTLGSDGNDVKCLQALLNTDTNTRVAATGVGSAGYETMYFGGLTKAAVVAFQNKYAAEVLTPVGLTAGTGFVGASTRAKLNAMLAGTSGTTGTTGTTGNLPAGCTSTTGYSVTTGESCATVSTLPAGCTSTTGYSPTTGESCAGTSSTGSGVTQTGAEGAITVSINPSPADGVKAYEGDSKVAVLGLKVKATGSDVDVQRVTLRFNSQPYSYFTNVYLYEGDTEVATSALNSTTVSKVSASDYQITLAGFTSKVVVPVNTSKVLTVKVDVLPGISSGLFVTTAGSKQNIIISTPSATSVRAVDQAGLNQYGGLANAAAWTAGNYRTFSVNASQTGSATLTVSLNANSPKKRNIVADSNGDIVGAQLMSFDVKATKDDMLIETVSDIMFASTTGTNQIPDTVYLVDDSGTVIGTATPGSTSGLATFSDLNYTVPKDTTKTLSIKVDDQLTVTSPTATEDGYTYIVTVTGTSISGSKTNGASFTGTGTAASNAAYVYGEGPVFTLASITTANTQGSFSGASSTLTATFNIQVAAVTGDVYIYGASTTDAFAIETVVGGVHYRLSDINYVQPSGTVAVGAAYKVAAGTSATFAVTANTTNAVGGVGTYDIRIKAIAWGHVSTTPGSASSSYMDGESTWISPAVYLR
ncbi:MAG: peptidoglycan-binding domain-containing protein [Minisyncoccales bacterium]